MAPVSTDLGYEVELERCRVAIETFEFTTDGEMHARATPNWGLLSDLFVPTAHAHPDHYAGGEVVGELSGRFVFDWRSDGKPLGDATLLEAAYTGMNFTFARAEFGDGVAADDPILGHSFDVAGTASRDGQIVRFEFVVDQDEGRRIVGAPFDLDLGPSADATLGVRFDLVDPKELDTVFDGIEFFALDPDGNGHAVIEEESAEINRLRRNLQVHDHYAVTVR
jgi:hypothetical protein